MLGRQVTSDSNILNLGVPGSEWGGLYQEAVRWVQSQGEPGLVARSSDSGLRQQEWGPVIFSQERQSWSRNGSEADDRPMNMHSHFLL